MVVVSAVASPKYLVCEMAGLAFVSGTQAGLVGETSLAAEIVL